MTTNGILKQSEGLTFDRNRAFDRKSPLTEKGIGQDEINREEKRARM